MKKVVFLGCENSHANTFLELVSTRKEFSGIQVVGVYSSEYAAAEKLGSTFGVPVLKHYADAAGEADGAVVTARHGKFHYEYSKPYIGRGLKAVFIDKPITVDVGEAAKFMLELKSAGIAVTGGSSIKHVPEILRLKAEHEAGKGGKTVGGYIRCPIALHSPYGGFYFYAEHLVDAVLTVFGIGPKSVWTAKNGETVTAVLRYEGFDVTAQYVGEQYFCYYAARSAETSVTGLSFTIDNKSGCFYEEWKAFYSLLESGCGDDHYVFTVPVAIMNAMEKAMQTGREVPVKYAARF